MSELKPCPFCGGKGRIRQKQMRFIGQNCLGWIKERRGFYIQCRRCKARGGLVSAEVIRKGMMTEDSVWRSALVDGAAEAWNRRAEICVPADAEESPSPKPTDPVPIRDVYYVMTECDAKTGTVTYELRERSETCVAHAKC